MPDHRCALKAQGTRGLYRLGDNSRSGVPNVLAHSTGNCHDDPVVESFFSTVKSELAYRFPSFADAKMEIFDYIEVFYNQRRRHSTLGQISPAAFERRARDSHSAHTPTSCIRGGLQNTP
jgi:hypothetical protein